MKARDKKAGDHQGCGYTVGQLIDELQNFKRDQPIGIAADVSGEYTVRSIYTTTLRGTGAKVRGRDTVWIDITERKEP